MWQKFGDRKVSKGDRNIAYFHSLVNARHRKNHLAELLGENGPVHPTQDMLEVATS